MSNLPEATSMRVRGQTVLMQVIARQGRFVWVLEPSESVLMIHELFKGKETDDYNGNENYFRLDKGEINIRDARQKLVAFITKSNMNTDVEAAADKIMERVVKSFLGETEFLI
jgi:hypothetical protein